MRLPGFSAEIVLRQRNTQTYVGGFLNGQGDPGVTAQLRVVRDPVGQCFSWCFLNGGTPLQCFFRCGPGQLGQFSTVGLLA
jgi:hypothetical protein